MNHEISAVLAALPWVLAPAIYLIRVRNSRSLDEFPAEAPSDAPLVSVIIPARNEAHNIERCMRSVLATTYPRMELIVVDDQSADGTGEIARLVAATDPRARVIDAPPLPPDWFGKQWACAAGAELAAGEILLFTDADTKHAPDLLARSANAIRAYGADLFSVVSRQELGSFWERVIQPQVLAMLQLWYGGTETVTDARRPWLKIANGQCLFMTRAAYDDVGGHAAVKHTVAEDLMLAQTFFRRGKRVVLVLGLSQISTRMYTSLREIIGGWRKNVVAGGLHAMPLFVRRAFPLLLLSPPLFELIPPLVLLAALLAGTAGTVLLWSALATVATLFGWIAIYARMRGPIIYAVVYPLGAALTLFIFTQALVRGSRVSWKGRSYRSA